MRPRTATTPTIPGQPWGWTAEASTRNHGCVRSTMWHQFTKLAAKACNPCVLPSLCHQQANLSKAGSKGLHPLKGQHTHKPCHPAVNGLLRGATRICTLPALTADTTHTNSSHSQHSSSNEASGMDIQQAVLSVAVVISCLGTPRGDDTSFIPWPCFPPNIAIDTLKGHARVGRSRYESVPPAHTHTHTE